MLQSGWLRRCRVAFVRCVGLVAVGASFNVVGCGSSGPAGENQDACEDLCGCIGDEGGDTETCKRVCAQASVASTDPASICRQEVGSSSCADKCSSFTDPAPGDQLGICGGNGALEVGSGFSCDLGGSHTIDYLALSVGCNDGETGSFTIDFGNGNSVDLDGDCGTAKNVGPFTASSLQIRMNSGGGDDGVISFSSQGSVGLIVGYR